MIASLDGVLAEKGLNEAVVEVQGVGYRVFLSLLALTRLPEVGAPVRVRVRTVVREDALDLYGFLTREEEELFLLLTSVSQVGPKLALGVLSGLEVPELISAISRGEVARLTQIHGVGKKTAERLVLELKDKVRLQAAPARTPVAAGPVGDLVSALVNLGFKANQAEQVAGRVSERMGSTTPFEAMVREALKDLRAGA
jgi:Holliday junction DNA helicase RuvA